MFITGGKEAYLFTKGRKGNIIVVYWGKRKHTGLLPGEKETYWFLNGRNGNILIYNQGKRRMDKMLCSSFIGRKDEIKKRER